MLVSLCNAAHAQNVVWADPNTQIQVMLGGAGPYNFQYFANPAIGPDINAAVGPNGPELPAQYLPAKLVLIDATPGPIPVGAICDRTRLPCVTYPELGKRWRLDYTRDTQVVSFGHFINTYTGDLSYYDAATNEGWDHPFHLVDTDNGPVWVIAVPELNVAKSLIATGTLIWMISLARWARRKKRYEPGLFRNSLAI